MLIGVRRKEIRNLNFHLAQQDRVEKWYNREICDTVADGRKNTLSEEGEGEKEREMEKNNSFLAIGFHI